jgi:hypothetical protein
VTDVHTTIDKGRLGWLMLLVGTLLLTGAALAPGAQADPKGVAKGWHEHHDGEATSAPATTAAPVTVASSGANRDCGAYCPSGVGLPSGNGNGGGAATGKPCAGCVGNADDKNPPGQANDGSDHNNGYECDGNHGVGRTNPAHSGCKTTTTVPKTTTTKVPNTTTTVPKTTTTVPKTTTTVPGTTTTVNPSTTPTTAPPNVLGATFTRTDPAALARTGDRTSPLFALGLLLEVAGATLLVIARRRRAIG